MWVADTVDLFVKSRMKFHNLRDGQWKKRWTEIDDRWLDLVGNLWVNDAFDIIPFVNGFKHARKMWIN